MLKKNRMLVLTFSGIDGAGKSTQISNVIKYFEGLGYRPIYLWSRGGYTSGVEGLKKIFRKIFRKSLPISGASKKRTKYLKVSLVSKLWLCIAILDLMRVYGINIRVWRLQGRQVICDRYLFDTLLDFKINFPAINVEDWLLWKILVWVSVKPDKSFLFMIPLKESVRRAEEKNDPFPENIEQREKRQLLYQGLSDQGNFCVMDGCQSVDAIFKNIKTIIK